MKKKMKAVIKTVKKTVYVATRRFEVGEQITSTACRSFQKIRVEVEEGPELTVIRYSNPNCHIGKFFHAPIEVGEYLVRSAIKNRKPKLPRFKIGDRVKLLWPVSYFFDGRNLTLLPGTILKVSDLETNTNTNLYTKYGLDISLGENFKPIAKIWKREPLIDAAPPPSPSCQMRRQVRHRAAHPETIPALSI